MLLGMAPEASFPAGRAQLQPGDLLLAYSDGVLDARNDSDEDFGSERLAAQLRLARAGPAETLLYSMLAAVQDFAGLNTLADDTSIVVVQHQRAGAK
jgi:sigma-B regulation protein RsbU (phosphoserine phosphatase)